MIVVDASVLAPAIADGSEDGERARRRLRHERVIGPDLVKLEVASVLRRLGHRGLITASQADAALGDLRRFPVVEYPTTARLGRIWELRHHLTVYDASYVALAEAVGAPLLTADRRLVGITGTHCDVELL